MLTSSKEAAEHVVSTPDGLGLRVRSWSVPRPRGLVIVAHGLGEHGGAYAQLARTLAPRLTST